MGKIRLLGLYGQFYYKFMMRMITKKAYLLVAVMRFLSHLLANTERRCKTYKSKCWFAQDMRRMRDLYVAMTCSRSNGFFTLEIEVSG